MVQVKRGRCHRALFSKTSARCGTSSRKTRAQSLDYISSSHVTVFQPTRTQKKLEVCYKFMYYYENIGQTKKAESHFEFTLGYKC